MKYLKVFTDFRITINPLNDSERGRLFTAMLEYAETGIEPDLKGNERYLWGNAKMHIDHAAAAYESSRENGRMGGRPTRKNQTKPDETKNNQTKPELTKQNQYKDKDKDKDKDNKNISPPCNPPTPGKSEAEKRFGRTDAVALVESLTADSVLREAACGWIEMRLSSKKNPLTKRAVELAMKKAREYGGNDPARQAAVFDQSVRNGWSGLFQLKEDARSGTIKRRFSAESASSKYANIDDDLLD